MKNENSADPKRLLTLERWRSAELEAAQTQHAKLEQITVAKRSAVDRVESDITATHSFVRDRMADGQPISPEALQRFAQFAAHQAQELSSAQQAFEASRVDSDAAHANVVQHFERLSVVEKLRERRQMEAVKDSARVAQKRLDEHALSRLGGVGAQTAKRKE